MKVAIDKGPLTTGHKVRGIGVHTRELLLALEEKTKKTRKATKSQWGKLKGLKIEAVDFSKADLTKYDLAHYPYFHPFFLTLPAKFPTKAVVTIHDLIPLIYPKHYPPGIKGKVRFMVQKARIKKAEAIITISETSKKDIVRFLGVPQEKIYVTYLAPRKIFKKLSSKGGSASGGEIGDWKLEIKRRYGLPERFVLYVGDVNYNKNISGLVRACRIAKVPLVICGKQAKEIKNVIFDLSTLEGPKDWIRYLFGKPHPEQAHYQELVSLFDKNGKVMRLGFIPDEDLVAIYNLALAYCQPSFYEGFGLPVLEAFACRTPVVATKTQALVEVAEGAALFADPNKPREIAEKISKLVKSPRARTKMIEEGQKIVKSFTWAKTARNTLKVYKKIL